MKPSFAKATDGQARKQETKKAGNFLLPA